ARVLWANDFLYWQVMCQAAQRSVRVFDYGRSKVDTGSYRFKKHWGFSPEPLYYEYGLVRATAMPNLSPTNPKYRLFINLWKRMPLPLSRLIGPFISRNLG
ncbi:MAG: peptidoglycan bridge formation protein FemAB, partial [Gammaproteobacteria bacterium]|nr:peptidoglycan bridge formation protein FemAB [Gammaproteobacteria bacterium]